jgi:hypothetical protein
MRLNFRIQAIAQFFGRAFQFEITLHVQPELGGGSKLARQPKSSVARDRTSFGNDFLNTRNGDADILGETIGSNTHRHHELLTKLFAGMNWGKVTHGRSSYIG